MFSVVLGMLAAATLASALALSAVSLIAFVPVVGLVVVPVQLAVLLVQGWSSGTSGWWPSDCT